MEYDDVDAGHWIYEKIIKARQEREMKWMIKYGEKQVIKSWFQNLKKILKPAFC